MIRFVLCFSEEFEAHTSSVTCLSLGKNSGRLLATGGEDCRVNIWAVSKANCIMVNRILLQTTPPVFAVHLLRVY